jgi:hypothetical protein
MNVPVAAETPSGSASVRVSAAGGGGKHKRKEEETECDAKTGSNKCAEQEDGSPRQKPLSMPVPRSLNVSVTDAASSRQAARHIPYHTTAVATFVGTLCCVKGDTGLISRSGT